MSITRIKYVYLRTLLAVGLLLVSSTSGCTSSDSENRKTKRKRAQSDSSLVEQDLPNNGNKSYTTYEMASGNFIVTKAETQTATREVAETKRGSNDTETTAPVNDNHYETQLLKLEEPNAARIQQQVPPLAASSHHFENKEKSERASKAAFQRLDELWDKDNRKYYFKESLLDDADSIEQRDRYIFTVRRRFDRDNRYKSTVVDVRSQQLKRCLQDVMKYAQGVSLVEETPRLDPNMLFLYLEDIRDHMKKLKAARGEDNGERRREKETNSKAQTSAETKAEHLGILVTYLDKDFSATKKTLFPLLANNMIAFDLLWALYKPNTIVYTHTYGDPEQPRAFKIEYCTKESSSTRGTWYALEGRYLDYNGKVFGMGTIRAEVPSFKGSRKISSLACYPIKYCAEVEDLKKKLIDRGRTFVALTGMNYRFHQAFWRRNNTRTGMAYKKHTCTVLKFNINARVMVDPATHRRINPNYQVSTIRPGGEENYSDMGSDNDGRGGCGGCSPEGESESESENLDNSEMDVDASMEEGIARKFGMDPSGGMRSGEDTFADEELLVASPVVLGFAFSEKQWLELTVSGIREVVWDEGAYQSLVLPTSHKSIVKSLVTSHKFSEDKNIDDVITGKGKGLVALLHGPPGTGKTLTAESIAELLKCPLYMVSAGELDTNPRLLERGLTEILEIAHAWGAVLVFDEADVFLEKRSMLDLHRNALVSIFLRVLEYFQGILFLTTNRVETFDEAFQSRIHIALKYSDLTFDAKKTIWKTFLDKVRHLNSHSTTIINKNDNDNDNNNNNNNNNQAPTTPLTPSSISSDFDDPANLDILARPPLNGRQIKNSTRTAQTMALDEGRPLAMVHVLRVLEVGRAFERDLKGG